MEREKLGDAGDPAGTRSSMVRLGEEFDRVKSLPGAELSGS